MSPQWALLVVGVAAFFAGSSAGFFAGSEAGFFAGSEAGFFAAPSAGFFAGPAGFFLPFGCGLATAGAAAMAVTLPTATLLVSRPSPKAAFSCFGRRRDRLRC